MTTYSTLARKSAETLGLNDNQAAALSYTLGGCVRAATELVRRAIDLQSDLNRMVEDVDANRAVNSLGVVQGRGLDVDRLCAVRQDRIDNLVMLLASFGVDAPSAVANELLAQAE